MFGPLKEIPAAARWLGFSGLIPFVGAALIGLIGDAALRDVALRALLAYGAVILSFLGGVRWGLAMTQAEAGALFGPLFISVLPSLVGWGALLLPTAAGLLTLAIALAALLIADTRLARAPRWYPVLRVPLSVAAIGALIMGLAA